MTRAQIGWLLTLAGLPWAFLILRTMWPGIQLFHAHTAWMQLGILGCGLCGIRCPKPAWAWPWWVWGYASVTLWWLWYFVVVTHQQYPMERLMPWVNLTSIVVAVELMQQQWDVAFLPRLWRVLAWSCLGVLAYCGLQLLQADPFFRNIDSFQRDHDQLVGMLGNPAHLAAYLACGWFVLWAQGSRWWPAMLAGVVVLFLTHSTGGVAAWAAGVWWLLWKTARRWSWGWLGLVALAAAWCVWQRSDWLNLSGRAEAWRQFYELWRTGQSVFGNGLGFVWFYGTAAPVGAPLHSWKHVHQEGLQLLLELGVLGTGLIVATFIAWWRRCRWVTTRLSLAAQALVVAFLVNSSVNWAAHLWQIGCLVLVAMATVLVLTQEAT